MRSRFAPDESRGISFDWLNLLIRARRSSRKVLTLSVLSLTDCFETTLSWPLLQSGDRPRTRMAWRTHAQLVIMRVIKGSK
jgi:hypothetical protein